MEESSLAVEACQYDFTHVGVNNAGHIDNTSDCAGFVEAKFTGPRRTISLSDNILNKHQCMETLVQVVSSLGVHHVDIEVTFIRLSLSLHSQSPLKKFDGN